MIIDGSFGLSGLDHVVLQKIGDRESFTILAGSGNTEVGFTTGALGGSVFTNILIKAINDLSSGGTSQILLSDLFKRVSAMMQAETQRMGMAQTPQLLTSSTKGDVVLVEARARPQNALIEQH